MPKYYEFEVSLQELQPRIWRRFLLRTTATFAQLHQAIQQSFGWQESHLWEFRLPTHQGRPIAGLPGGDEDERPTPDAKTVKLSTYFTGNRVVEWCEYLYDFGDAWTHDVKLIAVRSDKEAFKRRLLDGERAAPPEDCGGTPGYERMVHFVQTGEDTYDDDPDGLAAWLDGWRPDAFDLARAKAEFDR
jgi:hypothetical protein